MVEVVGSAGALVRMEGGLGDNVRARLQLMCCATQYTCPGFTAKEMDGEAEVRPPGGG